MPIVLLAVLAACTPEGGDSSGTPVGGDTCTALVSGEWAASGDALGMPMTTTLSMDVDACTFAFSAWNMTMDDLPSGGVLDGDAVQLDGLNHYWRSCTATVDTAGAFAGTCADDGLDFAFAPM